MATKKKLNLAVIGVGNMGRHHARVYSDIESVELVAIADVRRDIARKISKRYKCKYYTDVRELLKSGHIDAVSIAVPSSKHKDVACACLEKGISVLVEKLIINKLLKCNNN